MSTDVESITHVAIAMLAGWERRFGDPDSYQVHFQAWKSLSLPSRSLDEDSIANLADLTLETFREALDERGQSLTTPTTTTAAPAAPPHKRARRTPSPSNFSAFYNTCPLPSGFHLFHPTNPETRSLLRILSAMHTVPPASPTYIPRMRRVGLENIAWSPSHTLSVRGVPAREATWDPPAELNALYHARAAAITCGAVLLRESHRLHGVPWPKSLDLDAALAVHAVSCQHLRTEELLGTKYAELGVWSRVVMCAVSRDPERDEPLRRWVGEVGWDGWETARERCGRFLWMDGLVEAESKGLWDVLMGGEDGDRDGE